MRTLVLGKFLVRHTLFVVLAACTSSTPQADPPPEPARVIEPPPPRARVIDRPNQDDAIKISPGPLALTEGTGHVQVGLRALETLSNAIDAAGDDCAALARNLSPLAIDVARAKAALSDHKQPFKTLPRSHQLRARQQHQRALIKRCTAERVSKAAIANTVTSALEYDLGYGGNAIY